MIHYNTKATFENFENTNKSKVDCEMIHNKKEEEKHTHIHTQRNKKSNKNKKQKHSIKIIYQNLSIQSLKKITSIYVSVKKKKK